MFRVLPEPELFEKCGGILTFSWLQTQRRRRKSARTNSTPHHTSLEVLVVSSPNLYPPCTLLPVLPPHPISKVSNFCGYLFCRWPNASSLASLRCLPQVMCQQCRVWMNSSNSSYNSHRLCRGVFNNWCIAIGTDLLFLTRLIAHRGRFLL